VYYAAGLLLSRLCGVMGFRLRAWGVDHVPLQGGLVLVANHQSFLDPPFVGGALRRQISYMARRSLWSVPLLGWLLPKLHCIPVERGEADLGAMRQSIRLLRAGGQLLLFPEGTRTPDGEVQEFQSGFALLAARAGVPIVPAAIHGAFEAWPRHQWFPRPGSRVAVAYGEPVLPPAPDKAACQAAAAEMRARVVELKRSLKDRI
jgi:1-acyl-sn-glycerol-3-phosphate acyltransferase